MLAGKTTNHESLMLGLHRYRQAKNVLAMANAAAWRRIRQAAQRFDGERAPTRTQAARTA